MNMLVVAVLLLIAGFIGLVLLRKKPNPNDISEEDLHAETIRLSGSVRTSKHYTGLYGYEDLQEVLAFRFGSGDPADKNSDVKLPRDHYKNDDLKWGIHEIKHNGVSIFFSFKIKWIPAGRIKSCPINRLKLHNDVKCLQCATDLYIVIPENKDVSVKEKDILQYLTECTVRLRSEKDPQNTDLVEVPIQFVDAEGGGFKTMYIPVEDTLNFTYWERKIVVSDDPYQPGEMMSLEKAMMRQQFALSHGKSIINHGGPGSGKSQSCFAMFPKLIEDNHTIYQLTVDELKLLITRQIEIEPSEVTSIIYVDDVADSLLVLQDMQGDLNAFLDGGFQRTYNVAFIFNIMTSEYDHFVGLAKEKVAGVKNQQFAKQLLRRCYNTFHYPMLDRKEVETYIKILTSQGVDLDETRILAYTIEDSVQTGPKDHLPVDKIFNPIVDLKAEKAKLDNNVRTRKRRTETDPDAPVYSTNDVTKRRRTAQFKEEQQPKDGEMSKDELDDCI